MLCQVCQKLLILAQGNPHFPFYNIHHIFHQLAHVHPFGKGMIHLACQPDLRADTVHGDKAYFLLGNVDGKTLGNASANFFRHRVFRITLQRF